MKKKLMAMMLVAGMSLSCLAGCGQKETTNTPSSSEKAEASSSKTEESTPSSEEVKEEEVVTVTWCFRGDPQEDDEQVLEAMNEILREKYHLELNLIAIPNSEFNDRMNLMITSGEDWDICYTSNFANKFSPNVARGAFLALNDLIENTEAGQTLMSVYPEGLTDIATVNGSIYAIPNYQLLYTHRGAFIQKDLADEFGLDVDSVEKLSDLEPFMEWVRDNKEGIWSLCDNISHVYCIGEDWYVVYEAGVALGDETYTVVNDVEQESLYKSFQLINSYYKRGFLRSDAATVVDWSSDMAANRYAIVTGTVKPGGDAEWSEKYGEEYYMVGFGEPYLAYDAGASTMLGINVNSKNPEAALKMISVMWTDTEIFNMFLFGIEGEHYTKVSENRVELIADSGYKRQSYGWAVGNQFNAWLIPGQADDVWEVTEANNKSAQKSLITGFVLDSTSLETERAQVSSVGLEYGNGFKYVEDLDAWYKEFCEKLDLAGSDKIREDNQRQIDEWRAANGK